MKQFVATNKKELEKFTLLDVPAVEKITYLNEFDRAVQCVVYHPVLTTPFLY
jgi:uncharacterized protein